MLMYAYIHVLNCTCVHKVHCQRKVCKFCKQALSFLTSLPVPIPCMYIIARNRIILLQINFDDNGQPGFKTL